MPVSQSELTFESGGKAIRMDCYLPAVNRHKLPAVIGLHGSGGGYATMADPAGLLAEQGFAVYVLHYFDRTGTESADRQTIFRNFPAWMKTLWDAVSFVEKQAEVDPQRIALLGFSLGAYLALSNAAIDPRVRAAVEFFGGLPKEMKLFMRRFCPVLILHGDSDQTVPVAEAYDLQKVLERKKIEYEMKIYAGAGHGFNAEVWQDAKLRTLAFLQEHLSAQPAQGTSSASGA